MLDHTVRDWRSPAVVLLCASFVVTIAMGIRHGFGLFLQPMTVDLGLTRQTFAFALGLQNLVWGLVQPVTGMIADRYGAGRVLLAGAFLYAVGLAFMALSSSAFHLTASAGVLIGLGLSGTTFSTVFGVVGRVVAPGKRARALAIVSAAGSFGQFIMVPGTQSMIAGLGWMWALLILAAMAALIAPAASGLVEQRSSALGHGPQQSVLEAVREAFSHNGFKLLTLGYFVCGFQVVFIGLHLPAFLKDRGLSANVGMSTLALIGLFNIAGTYGWGHLGSRFTKKHLLSVIYLLRSAVIIAFLSFPITPVSAYAFACVIGLLWLGTVPLTSAVVAQIFGVKYFSMLSGFVFLSHQIGSFLGAWLGGYLFDKTGSYNVVWFVAAALGIVAAIANWPIDERPVQRLRASEAIA
jgi:predicted MFS family arabinose efflux permease